MLRIRHGRVLSVAAGAVVVAATLALVPAVLAHASEELFDNVPVHGTGAT